MRDCIEWTGTLKNGYGWQKFQGKWHYAHRVAFFEAHGYWPEECRHTCDNKLCINLAHLIDGTHADNMQDMIDRDRMARGEKHGRAKLLNSDIPVIRKLKQEGYSSREIASQYPVTQHTINRILRKAKRGGWDHI